MWHACLAGAGDVCRKLALPALLATNGMAPNREQLLTAINEASRSDALLEYALLRLAGFIARHTTFSDLGRALGAAYPGNTTLPESIERVALPRTSKDDKDLTGQDCRTIVTCLRQYGLLDLAVLVFEDAQRIAFSREHPNQRVPYQLTSMLSELIRSTDPDRPRDEKFCPLDRLANEAAASQPQGG